MEGITGVCVCTLILVVKRRGPKSASAHCHDGGTSFKRVLPRKDCKEKDVQPVVSFIVVLKGWG
jgi:hypothetical protein